MKRSEDYELEVWRGRGRDIRRGIEIAEERGLTTRQILDSLVALHGHLDEYRRPLVYPAPVNIA